MIRNLFIILESVTERIVRLWDNRHKNERHFSRESLRTSHPCVDGKYDAPIAQNAACETAKQSMFKSSSSRGRKWWAMRDSNSRHPRCKRGALPTELIALRVLQIVSAASVAVIYSERVETARAFVKFFCFFRFFAVDRRAIDVVMRGQLPFVSKGLGI